jgi:hypothetical protein
MKTANRLSTPSLARGTGELSREQFLRKEPKVFRVVVAALSASCLLALPRGVASADQKDSPESLPEPALRFAKEASLRVTDSEREWLKVAEGLAKYQADFTVKDGSESSLREQASRLLDAAKKLLGEQKRLGSDLERFKDTLRKAASHYRDVAVLCKGQAAEARAEEIKEDYLALGKVYEVKARSAGERAKALSIPAGTKAKAELIEEGNLFVERFVEALSIGPAGDSDRDLFAGRLKRHGERCKALSDELTQAIEALLEEAEQPEVRKKLGEKRKDERTAHQLVATSTGSAKSRPKKDLSALAGASWSSPLTIQGVRCVQLIRFEGDGTCLQSVYRMGPKGRGPLIGSIRVGYAVNDEGIVNVYQAGMVIERGEITFRGKDEWSYEILSSLANPQLAGTKTTFTREVRP